MQLELYCQKHHTHNTAFSIVSTSKFVAKIRTYSSDSNHMLKYTLEKQLIATSQTSWFCQKLNPLLVQVGEVKVIVVNKSKVLRWVLCWLIMKILKMSLVNWAVLLSKMKIEWVSRCICILTYFFRGETLMNPFTNWCQWTWQVLHSDLTIPLKYGEDTTNRVIV